MTVRKARKLRSVAAVLLCSVLLIMASAIVFPRALAATNDTDGGIAVITEESADQEQPAGEVPSGDLESGAADDEGTTEPGTTDIEEQPAGTGTESGEPAGDEVAGEEKSAADKPAADSYENTEADKSGDEGVEPYTIEEITAQRWVTNQDQKANFTIDKNLSYGGQSINSPEGMTVENIAAAQRPLNGYTFWKASLKGSDRNVNYGKTQSGDSGDNQTSTGAQVSRIRYDENGRLQFEFSNAGSGWVSDQMTSVSGNGENLQLVFYYMQDRTVTGDNGEKLVDLHLSDWFENPWCNSYYHGKAVGVVVVDDSITDGDKTIGKATPMYFHQDSNGITNITASISNALDGYDVVSADKYAATKQVTGQQGNTEFSNYNLGEKIQSYTMDQLLAGDVSVVWKGGEKTYQEYTKPTTVSGVTYDPNRVIIVIHVQKTGQVSLTKQVTGENASDYATTPFKFSATLTLPSNSEMELKQSYPISGTSDGSTQVNVELASDKKSGQISGILANPDSEVVIKNLPAGTRVQFFEINDDPSEFETTYEYVNKDQTVTDAAVALPKENNASVGKCTVTNETSAGKGKLTVSKTFKGIDTLTSAEQRLLNASFKIVSTDDQITLDTSNAKNTSGTIYEPVNGSATYTWTMEHLTENQAVTLEEQGFEISGKGVVTSSSVNNDGTQYDGQVSTTITQETQNVGFVNEYSDAMSAITVTKQWAEGTTGHPKDVTVLVKGTVGTTVVKEQELVITTGDAASGSAEVSGLPSRYTPEGETSAQDIEYSVEEVKVGNTTIDDSPYVPNVKQNEDGSFTVTNSLKYSLQILKYKAGTDDKGIENATKLAGAVFELKDLSGKLIETLTTDSNGLSNAYEGIADGTYTLTETKAPAGYQLLQNPLTIEVKNGKLYVDNSEGMDSDSNNVFIVKIANEGIQPIPSTGGTGNIPLFAAGMVAIAGAVIYLSKRTNL